MTFGPFLRRRNDSGVDDRACCMIYGLYVQLHAKLVRSTAREKCGPHRAASACNLGGLGAKRVTANVKSLTYHLFISKSTSWLQRGPERG